MNHLSRETGEGRAEFLRTWGRGFDQKADGKGRGGAGGAAQFVRGNYKTFSWGIGEEMCVWGRALGRIDVGVGYTPGARCYICWLVLPPSEAAHAPFVPALTIRPAV